MNKTLISHTIFYLIMVRAKHIRLTRCKMERTNSLAAPAGRTQQVFETRQGNVTRCGLLNNFINAHFGVFYGLYV